MDNLERLNLKKLIDNSQCENNTEYIKQLKHSSLIREDVFKIQKLKKEKSKLEKNDPEEFAQLCKKECFFLFTNYTDVFNKLMKNELDFIIMNKMLDVLQKIENGKVDQHEGSAMFGQILKELYIDSALKRGENIDKSMPPVEEKIFEEGKKISWKDFKNLNY